MLHGIRCILYNWQAVLVYSIIMTSLYILVFVALVKPVSLSVLCVILHLRHFKCYPNKHLCHIALIINDNIQIMKQ